MKKFPLTIIFLILIFIIPCLYLIIKDEDFSILENRPLEKFPTANYNSFISGEFSSKLNSYLEDHFPFRNNFITLNSYFNIYLGREDINDVYLGKNNYLIEMFNDLDLSITDKNIFFINKLSKRNNVSLMLIPTSTEILKHLLPKFSVNVDQEKYLDYIKNSLSENVKFINPTTYLKNKNMDYIYYKTDHHYTTLGAYYSYLEFCKSFNITPLSLNEFNIKKISNNFLGSLSSKTNLINQEKDSIYIFNPLKENPLNVYYMDKTSNSLYEFSHLDNERNQYNIFLDNNHPLIKIKTSIKNNEKILIIKDSYANSFIPFLTNHFNEIHVIDLRFYSSNITNYLEENNFSNILLYYNVKNFSKENNLVFINDLKGD